MIVEIADIVVLDGQHEAFKTAIARGVKEVLSKSKGYLAHKILAGHETPNRFILMVEWQSIEDHNLGFRQSAAFADWRAIIGPFFKQPPHVEHFVVSDHA